MSDIENAITEVETSKRYADNDYDLEFNYGLEAAIEILKRYLPNGSQNEGQDFVRTCRTCRFWGWLNDDKYFEECGTKSCQLLSDWPASDGSQPIPAEERYEKRLASPGPFAGADGASFDTKPDFGCVQWEVGGALDKQPIRIFHVRQEALPKPSKYPIEGESFLLLSEGQQVSGIPDELRGRPARYDQLRRVARRGRIALSDTSLRNPTW